jgi:hypothetical protein
MEGKEGQQTTEGDAMTDDRRAYMETLTAIARAIIDEPRDAGQEEFSALKTLFEQRRAALKAPASMVAAELALNAMLKMRDVLKGEGGK